MRHITLTIAAIGLVWSGSVYASPNSITSPETLRNQATRRLLATLRSQAIRRHRLEPCMPHPAQCHRASPTSGPMA